MFALLLEDDARDYSGDAEVVHQLVFDKFGPRFEALISSFESKMSELLKKNGDNSNKSDEILSCARGPLTEVNPKTDMSTSSAADTKVLQPQAPMTATPTPNNHRKSVASLEMRTKQQPSENEIAEITPDEIVVVEETLKQLHKAMEFVERKKNIRDQSARLEVEKGLLLNYIKQGLVKSCTYQQCCTPNIIYGEVEVTQIYLYLDEKYAENQQFFCTISNRNQIFSTQSNPVDKSGLVVFKESIKMILPTDFRLFINIFKHDKKKSKKIIARPDMDQSPFVHCCEVIVPMDRHISLPSRLGRLTLCISGEPKFDNVHYENFLEVAKGRKNNPLIWDNCWFRLDGTTLTRWRYPTDVAFNQPIEEIDLRNCVNMRNPEEFECCRPRTLVLTLKNSCDYYFSSKDIDQYQMWKNHFVTVLHAIKKWHGLEKSYSH